MKHRIKAEHSCRDEMWRLHPPAYGEKAWCTCGKPFKHMPLTAWRLLASWRKRIPALGGDLWVALSRNEKIRLEREEQAARTKGTVESSAQVEVPGGDRS